MLWFDSGSGAVKLGNPTNTGWQTVGTIGPPMKWTNVDIPSTAWKIGDIKPSFAGDEAGWVILNDGTIGTAGTGATCRANPDCAALFGLFWLAGGLKMYVAGTWTEVGRGGSAAADFAAGRHLQTLKVFSRALASQGQGEGMVNKRWWCAWDGDEYVQLMEVHLPGHYHTFGVPDHGRR